MPVRPSCLALRVQLTAIAGAALLCLSTSPAAQAPAPAWPRVELVSAATVELPGEADSNSPLVWERVGGQPTLFVLTSVNGRPSVASGRNVVQMGRPEAVEIEPWPGGGVWMEAIIPDVDGTWYGYYHNENVASVCRGSEKVIPQIGAARSRDRGRTWEPLGTVLEAPPRSYDCTTSNTYFVGGVGDFSVQLDRQSRDLYFFYSAYTRDVENQGVGVARLAWADRDAPQGKIAVWQGSWIPAMRFARAREERWAYPAASPTFQVSRSWHEATVDAFWGPSVHWNTYLGQYVMLLNRARNGHYEQEGIYVSFAPTLDDPQAWTAPTKILNGGTWYPQVVGLESGVGTDRIAGEQARLFMLGTSRHIIRFIR